MTAVVAFTAFRAPAGRSGTPYRALGATLLFVGAAGVMVLPWGLKNYVWTGNPVYPLFDQWFNAAAPADLATVPPVVLRKLVYGESWLEILLVPLRIFFQGQDDALIQRDGLLIGCRQLPSSFSLLWLWPLRLTL